MRQVRRCRQLVPKREKKQKKNKKQKKTGEEKRKPTLATESEEASEAASGSKASALWCVGAKLSILTIFDLTAAHNCHNANAGSQTSVYKTRSCYFRPNEFRLLEWPWEWDIGYGCDRCRVLGWIVDLRSSISVARLWLTISRLLRCTARCSILLPFSF